MNTTMGKQQLHWRPTSILVLTIVFVSLNLNGCSSGLKLTSDWQQNEMTLDGTDAQWQRGLYYDKVSDMVYGVRNDENYIYLFLKTQNRSTQMQIMRQGLTVWFDRENGKNQTFGIHYPIRRRGPGGGGIADTVEDRPLLFLDQEFPEMEIMGPNKEDVQQFSTLESPGIRVKLGRTRETLIYECRVPLKKSSKHPFAVEPGPLNRIGIEFETGEMKAGEERSGIRADGGHDRSEGVGEDDPAEGGVPGSGMRRSGGFQGGRLRNVERTNRMAFWMSVQLAHQVSP
jgi:hypothetical protein